MTEAAGERLSPVLRGMSSFKASLLTFCNMFVYCRGGQGGQVAACLKPRRPTGIQQLDGHAQCCAVAHDVPESCSDLSRTRRPHACRGSTSMAGNLRTRAAIRGMGVTHVR